MYQRAKLTIRVKGPLTNIEKECANIAEAFELSKQYSDIHNTISIVVYVNGKEEETIIKNGL